jgi:DNA-binding NarL/FixJ family response regulator
MGGSRDAGRDRSLPTVKGSVATIVRSTREPMPPPTRILLVDNNAQFRSVLGQQLRSQPDFTVVGDVAIGGEAVHQARELTPDVIVLDIEMREMDAVSQIHALRLAAPAARIIALSIVRNGRYRDECRRAGVHVHLYKDSTVDQIFDAVRAAASAIGQRA